MNSSAREAPKNQHIKSIATKLKHSVKPKRDRETERIGKEIKDKCSQFRNYRKNGKHEARDELGRVSRTHSLTDSPGRGPAGSVIERWRHRRERTAEIGHRVRTSGFC